MNFSLIKKLATHMPFEDPYFAIMERDLNCIDSSRSKLIAKFIRAYKDVKFGWNFVQFLIRNKKQFPGFLEEPYLKRAYEFERYGTEDYAILEAIAYNTGECDSIDTLLQSFLIVDGITFKEISSKLGISEDTVRAYEALFFNVLDRSKEAAWLASLIYPETRFVEMSPDYVNNTNYQWLLKRSGYNNGVDAVSYFAGLRTQIATDVVNASTKMENALMVNGYLLATNGYVNQRDAQGIFHAKTIISAEKQGGSGSQDNTAAIDSNVANYIFKELTNYGHTEGLKMLELRKNIHKDS